jgi:hypothetical protein
MNIDDAIAARTRDRRPKVWDEVTDDDIIAAVRFAAEKDGDGIAMSASAVLWALCHPTPEQWPTQPPPPQAAFGLGIIPPFGEGSSSAAKVAPRLRRLVKEGRLEAVPMMWSRGKKAPNGYRPVNDTRGDDVAREPDDNTLDNAGEVGRELADTMSQKITETIDGFPGLAQQRAAIARIVANTLYNYAEEVER